MGQTRDVTHFTLEEMLSRYERGWENRGVLAELEGDEREFVKILATKYGSWLSLDL